MKEPIKKGLSPKRDTTSYQTLHDIVIPAGTLLRAAGDGEFSAAIGFGPDSSATFTMEIPAGSPTPAVLRRVVT